MPQHPDRVEIARYLLSRGLDPDELVPAPARLTPMLSALKAAPGPTYPAGLAPVAAPISPRPGPTDPLPHADVVVITWTVDELAGLAHIMTPRQPPTRWYPYARDFDSYRPKIRPGAPAATSRPPRSLAC